MDDRLEKNTRTTALLTILSRITGLVRDGCISRIFGVGAISSAFFFAFMVPNLFRRLFGDGALAASFLPVYGKLAAKDPGEARKLASLLLGTMSLALGGMVLVGEIVLMALASRQESPVLLIRLLMITLPYMPLVCVVAMLGAMLQVRGRFGPTAAAPIIMNLCMILAMIAGPFLLPGTSFMDGTEHRITLVAASIIVAGMIQIAWSLFALRAAGWARNDLGSAGSALREVLRRAAPMALGLGVLQINIFVDGCIAQYPDVYGPTILGIAYPLHEGAMASITFAQRLYQLPLGVFSIAFATAIFPMLARQAGDTGLFVSTMRRGMRQMLYTGLPASVGLMVVARPLSGVLLEGGAFGADDSVRVARVLLAYAPAVWAYALIHLYTRAFYARGEVMAPVRAALAVVGLNIVLNMTLIWTPLGEAGLGASTAICGLIQFLLLRRAMEHRLPGCMDRAVMASWARTAVATVFMLVAVLASRGLLDSLLARGIETRIAYLALLVIGGATVFLVVTWAFRMPELSWLIGRSTDREEEP